MRPTTIRGYSIVPMPPKRVCLIIGSDTKADGNQARSKPKEKSNDVQYVHAREDGLPDPERQDRRSQEAVPLADGPQGSSGPLEPSLFEVTHHMEEPTMNAVTSKRKQ